MNCEGVRTGIIITGTLNNWSDVDQYWQMELAIPFVELPSVIGPKVGDVWRFLVGRYDYSIYLFNGVEFSCSASLSKVDFHLPEEWRSLQFMK